MAPSIPDILAKIVERKRVEVEAKRPLRFGMEQNARFQTTQRRDFRAILSSPPAVIAEMKRASPSKGVLSASFNPGLLAQRYFAGGAAAISVLTDKDFFQGSLSDLKVARATAPLPVLRKDFTIDEIDVIEAAACGADAILLIAAILSRDEMDRFRRLAESYHMAALVEVHDESELDAALESGASVIGVNNRDLHTFDVRLETAEALAPRIPAGVGKVAESGIHSRGDLTRLAAAGFEGFLIGEHLMTAADPSAALKALLA
jgi:indole-3-glycerol phosphate synthase